MKLKTHEFKVILETQPESGCGDRGQYELSRNLLTVPEQLLNQQAVVETLPDGVSGINECCSRIFVDGTQWLVLGDVRSVCYTNDVVVVKY